MTKHETSVESIEPESMQDIGGDLYVETWKCIGKALRRSDRCVRYWANREHDPLPVFRVGRIVRLNADDYREWLARQRAEGFKR